MRFLLRCNMVSVALLQLTPILLPWLFFCFPFILFLFPFFLVGLEYCTLKSLEHFSFNCVRWGGSLYFRPSSRGGLANFTRIAGVGHLISEPKFKIPTPPPPLLISDKSLRTNISKFQFDLEHTDMFNPLNPKIKI